MTIAKFSTLLSHCLKVWLVIKKLKRRTKNILVADQHPKSPGSNLFNTHYASQFQSILLDSIHPNIRIADSEEHTNTQISLCIYGLCADILRRPVRSVCEHIFCFLWFAKCIKSKLESENFRPTCIINFKIDNISCIKKSYWIYLK